MFASEFGQRIHYRRRDDWNWWFAAARWGFGAGYDMNVNYHWRVNHVGWSIAIEVALLYAAIFEGDRSLRHDL